MQEAVCVWVHFVRYCNWNADEAAVKSEDFRSKFPVQNEDLG
jgi:hypothetical protein